MLKEKVNKPKEYRDHFKNYNMSSNILSALNRNNYHDFETIKAICSAFCNNHRMKALVGNFNYEKGLEVIISYCYFLVKKINGVYISKDNSAFLLYYIKSEFYSNICDIIHYLYLAVFVVGIRRVFSVYKREKKIKAIRQTKIDLEQDADYIYVWFLAQKTDVNSLAGLFEAKTFIINQAKQKGLPLYLETTEERLIHIYVRIGFIFYNSIVDQKSGMKVWFARCNPLIEN